MTLLFQSDRVVYWAALTFSAAESASALRDNFLPDGSQGSMTRGRRAERELSRETICRAGLVMIFFRKNHFVVDTFSIEAATRFARARWIDRETRRARACERGSNVRSFLDEESRIVPQNASREAKTSRDRSFMRIGEQSRAAQKRREVERVQR